MGRLKGLLAAVRRSLLLRSVLRWTVGAGLGVGLCALALALLMPDVPRWPTLVALAIGPLVGFVLGLRRLPPEQDLVLYVDRKLAAGEAILTSWELGDDLGAFDARTRERAEARLGGATPRDVRPRVLGQELWGVPFVAAQLSVAMLIPIPPAPGPAPGPDVVQIEDSDILRRIERLEEARTNDPDQERQIEEIAREAAELRRLLDEGLERRDALDRVSELRERLQNARRPETPERRRAREAAVEAMEDEPEMSGALSERDLEALDREVERAAARREAADRQRAQEALQRAADAARAAGDEELAESLLDRQRLLRRRSEQAELARQLAEAMPELAGGLERGLERLSRDGDGGELNQEMVDAMREAWNRLTPEERERLAEAMRNAPAGRNDRARDGQSGPSQPMSADEIERMLRQALEDTDRLQMQCGGGGGGGIPVPGQGGGGGGQGSGGGGQGNGGGGQGGGEGHQGGGQGQGGGGPGGGGGRGPSGGETRDLGSDEGPLARVRPVVRPGAPTVPTVDWINPEGQPVDVAGTDTATGAPVAGESGGIERNPIPEDYRDHVRTYFGGGD